MIKILIRHKKIYKMKNKIIYLTYQNFPAHTANSLQTIANIKHLVKNDVLVDLYFPLRESNSDGDIEVLKNALICFEEGASDEKRMAINSLESLLRSKKKVLREFESQAPGYQFEMEFMYESV